MILELETAVENYIRLLRAKGYYVTFCFRRDTGFCALPAKYNIHYHPYCLALKTSPEAWDQCIHSQKKVYERLKNGAFFGMCLAGVEEFVFPIPGGAQQDKIIGFVSGSGFKTRETEAKKRVRRVAEEYLISKETLFGLYQKLSPSRLNLPRSGRKLSRCAFCCHTFQRLPKATAPTIPSAPSTAGC